MNRERLQLVITNPCNYNYYKGDFFFKLTYRCAIHGYEWRHNGVLAFLYSTLMENKPDGFTVHADIEGAKVNGGTIPPEIMITNSSPDLVIINVNTNPTNMVLV